MYGGHWAAQWNATRQRGAVHIIGVHTIRVRASAMSNPDGADPSICLGQKLSPPLAKKSQVVILEAVVSEALSGVPLIASSARRDPTAAAGLCLNLVFLGNLDERGDSLTIEFGNLGDDTLEAFPEITPGEGEIDDCVPEGHGGEVSSPSVISPASIEARNPPALVIVTSVLVPR
jgi:hypothetical protein